MQALNESLIEIDGSYGEGGGQILRTSLALSAIFKKPVAIHHIRSKRNKPGLRPQHLKGVEALAQITGAKVEGCRIGSREVTFLPQEICPGDYEFEVGNGKRSAGSVTLLLQALLPVLCLAKHPSHVNLMGGTHVAWSPPFHYVSEILFPALSAMGVCSEAKIERWGWYPTGGGVVRVGIQPHSRLIPVKWLDRGTLKRVRGLSAIANLPRHVAERQRDYAVKQLRGQMDVDAEITLLEDVPAQGIGAFFFLIAESEKMVAGFSSLGERGKRAEEVAKEAVDALKDYIDSEACIDSHLADQLLVFMALAGGESSFTTHRVTDHLVTNLWVIQKFVDLRVSLSGEVGQRGRVDICHA